jgi:large subunit ribosomal protein L24
MATLKLRKGDRVVVLQGKDRGKEGMITRVLPAQGTVIVEGVNIAKKSQKKRRATMQAGIIDKDMPIPVSNVAIISPSDGKPTRIGYRFDDNGNKIRICQRTKVDL